jgi:phenylacetate-CoA ligase
MYRTLATNVLFRLHEWAKRHPTYAILAEMEAADRMSAFELEQLRRAKLQRFVDYCYTHVPYVRRSMQGAGIGPGRIQTPEDLAIFPFMNKAEIRRNRQELQSDVAGKLASRATGGSTGNPLIFDISKRRTASHVACRQRVARWWGLTVGDPELALWGSPIELAHQDWRKSLRDKLLASTLLSAFEMNDATMSRYLNIIETGKFRQIIAYPSAIFQLCLHARKTGRDLRRTGIKVVFVTSEVLFPHQREIISETLNCPVANGYGGRESGFISHECPQGGMHILADAVIVEIIGPDGRVMPPGEAGEIVVTDLYSEESPFLRYATGDIGVLSRNRCSCGRVLPLLERIDGRANDSVVAPDGRIINAEALVYLLRDVEGIEQFKIYQKRVDFFHVQIVRNDRFRLEGEDKLRNGWGFLLRAPIKVTFEYVPKLDADLSGKFRFIVSEVPGARYLQTVPAGYQGLRSRKQ